jgi:hypothetical protein
MRKQLRHTALFTKAQYVSLFGLTATFLEAIATQKGWQEAHRPLGD